MNKILKISALAAITLFAACETERSDDFFDDDVTIIQFQEDSGTSPLPVGPEDALEREICVGVSKSEDFDRTVQIEVGEDSDFTTYQLTEIVIPAGEFEGCGTLTTDPDPGFTQGEQTLILELAGIEGEYPDGQPIQFNNRVQSIEFTTFEFCPLPDDFLVGTYEVGDVVAFLGPLFTTPGPNFPTQTVEITQPQPGSTVRTFSVPLLPALSSTEDRVTLDLVCGEIRINADTGITCTGSGSVKYATPAVPTPFDEMDGDDRFEIEYLDDAETDCLGSPGSSIFYLEKQ